MNNVTLKFVFLFLSGLQYFEVFSQQSIYPDTLLPNDGSYCFISGMKCFGKTISDSSISLNNNIRSLDPLNDFHPNSICVGKWMFYYGRFSKDSLGNIVENDTTKISMIKYFDSFGTDTLTVYLNSKGEAYYFYRKDE